MEPVNNVKKTWAEAYRYLESRGVENARAEAGWLVRSYFGCGPAELAEGRSAVPRRGFWQAVVSRGNGTPLQYILGSQDFCGLEILVGRGVLIPRPETEVLVSVALRHLGNGRGTVYDLCAGTGCVSLAIAEKAPCAEIFAVEKYASAFGWLEKNLACAPGKKIRAVRADVMKDNFEELPDPDVIAANPPYIMKGDIAGLQREVRHEPLSALDGGGDGLDFVRRIADLASSRLSAGGWICIEIGAGQADRAAAALVSAGFADVSSAADESGTERVVAGRRERK